jgi:hypothetical protein
MLAGYAGFVGDLYSGHSKRWNAACRIDFDRLMARLIQTRRKPRDLARAAKMKRCAPKSEL